MSESIRTAVKGKINAGFDGQGVQRVKNIGVSLPPGRFELHAAPPPTSGPN